MAVPYIEKYKARLARLDKIENYLKVHGYEELLTRLRNYRASEHLDPDDDLVLAEIKKNLEKALEEVEQLIS